MDEPVRIRGFRDPGESAVAGVEGGRQLYDARLSDAKAYLGPSCAEQGAEAGSKVIDLVRKTRFQQYQRSTIRIAPPAGRARNGRAMAASLVDAPVMPVARLAYLDLTRDGRNLQVRQVKVMAEPVRPADPAALGASIGCAI